MSKTMREWEEQRYREREGKIQEMGKEQYSQSQPRPFPNQTPAETEDALTRPTRQLQGLAGIPEDAEWKEDHNGTYF